VRQATNLLVARAAATRWSSAACAALALAISQPAQARDGTDGLSDSALVAGRELRLNGAGVGMRVIFKVYAMGLYVAERKRTAAEVMASNEPRRLAMALLRDVSGAGPHLVELPFGGHRPGW